MQRRQLRQVGGAHREHHAGGDVLKTLGRRGRHRAGKHIERDRAVGTFDRAIAAGLDLASGRVVELEHARAVGLREFDQRLVEPVGTGIGGRGQARIGLGGVSCRVVLHQPHFTDLARDRQRAVDDLDVVVAAVLVVRVTTAGAAPMDDEFEAGAGGVVLRVHDRNVEHHFAGTGAVVVEVAESDGTRPLVDHDAGLEPGVVQAAGGPDVHAPRVVSAVEAFVVHTHGADVGRGRTRRVGLVVGRVTGDLVDRAAVGNGPELLFVTTGLARPVRRLAGAAAVFHENEVERRAGGRHVPILAGAGHFAFGHLARPVAQVGAAVGVHRPAGVVGVGAVVVQAHLVAAATTPAAARSGHGHQHGFYVCRITHLKARGRWRGRAVAAATATGREQQQTEAHHHGAKGSPPETGRKVAHNMSPES